MKKYIKINLTILVIFCLSFSNLFFEVRAADIEEESQQQEKEVENNEKNSDEPEEEKTLDDLQLEKSELEQGIEESNDQIIVIEDQISKAISEIAEINQNIYEKELEIETLEAQEKDLLSYIEKAEKELEKSNKRYDKQKKLLETRLIAMYEMGETSYLEILLNSKTITEFLSNYYLIGEVSNADNELLESVDAEKKYNEKLKESLENKKKALADSKKVREKNKILLSNMSIIKNNRMNELSEEELELQRNIEEYQNQVNEIEKEIRLLAVANISERYVGGVMAWPVPGYTRITSPFGMRTHPITGVYKLHTGVDVGAPYGTNFIAANDGVVTYAGWNNAYGNMVIIDHGGGISTLYAHGSEILVKAGDTVYQGTPILKVGSTGYSTGAHAHFEVRVNGEYVQPLDYITSYGDSSKNEKQNEENESEQNDDKNENVEDEENEIVVNLNN